MPSMKKVTKRRRVSFADEPSIVGPPPPLSPSPMHPSRVDYTGDTDDTVPLADIIRGNAGRPQHSLLNDQDNFNTIGNGNANSNGANATPYVTAFDISEDIEQGAALAENDDGVIPVSLQRSVLTEEENRADFSSDDDDGRLDNGDRAGESNEPDSWADAMAEMPAANGDSSDSGEPPMQRRKIISNDTPLSLAQCVVQLAVLLMAEETVTRAMQRLRKNGSGSTSEMDRMTDLCSALLDHGVFSAYEMNREALLGVVKWDLAWSNCEQQPPAEDGHVEIHANNQATMMFAWEKESYFSKKDRIAWARPHAAENIPWQTARHIFSSPR